jgi:predicted porin
MKKMLSLAAMFAVLAYASPASAELKLSGDASVRMRGQFQDEEINDNKVFEENEVNYAYRLRLKAAADLGNGYYFKSVLTSDNAAGGWNTVTGGEEAKVNISQLYFGRNMENCHYAMGRLPLNSVNNPIFDITLYPFAPVDTSVAIFNMDRVFGLNYGAKIGSGEANATLVILNNISRGDTPLEGDGIFNDGYALHLSYKDKIGDVTVEPQAIITLTNFNSVTPNTFGANLSFPAGSAKIGLSGFYTACDDTVPNTTTDVDYSGYLFRIKGEVGNFMAWIDLNQTEDNVTSEEVDNLFIWAQYNFKIHESAAGTFSLTPIVRYWAQGAEPGGIKDDYSRLRTELVATVTF